MENLNVGIVGGSIAGCATAISLSKQGHTVKLFERSMGRLEDRGAGIGLPIPTLENLQSRGLLGADFPYLTISNRYYKVPSREFMGKTIWTQALGALALTNWGALYRDLRSRVDDDSYHTGLPVIKITQDKIGAYLHFEDGTVEKFDLVVCADGVDSIGRSLVSSGSCINYAGYIAWRGFIPETEMPKQPPPTIEEESELILMIEPEGLDETLLEPLELDEEGSGEEEVQLAVPKGSESEETPQEAKSDLKSDAEKSGDQVEEEEELEEKPVKKKAQPTTAQLLDFDDEEEEDFDDEDGLSAEETDETDVVFGTGPITQPSMIKFMHQYPDSVLKFLLRRNLDGRPLPGEFEKIYDQWQQRGLMRGRLKRHLLKMMEWEEIPDTPIHELVGQIRNRILDLRLEQD